MSGPRRLLEVAVQTVADARAAAQSGADRLELCSALEVGGLTPSWGLLRAALAAVRLPIVVLIRPRPGAFCYAADEIDVMCADVGLAFELGATAVAVGALRPDGGLDEAACRRLVAAARGGAVVSHRAFDLVCDPAAALERLISLGFTRVLTSGGAARLSGGADSAAGVARIAALQRQATGRIEILPVGGIRAENVAAVLTATGCTQAHTACGTTARDPWPRASRSGALGFSAVADDAVYRTVDATQVAALRAALDDEWGSIRS
jgi:copper homeostasis protein